MRFSEQIIGLKIRQFPSNQACKGLFKCLGNVEVLKNASFLTFHTDESSSSFSLYRNLNSLLYNICQKQQYSYAHSESK